MWRAKRVTSDAGETLIEVVLSVIILGIAAVALLESMATSTKLSDIHRKQANAAAYVRDYAEAVQNWVAAPSSSSNPTNYQVCASSTAYSPSTVSYTVPVGYVATESAALTWNGGAWGACSGATDNGIQRVTLTVATNDGRASEHLDLIIRRPCRTADKWDTQCI